MDRNTLHRRAVESRYDAMCSIYEYDKVTDEKTKLSKGREKAVAEKLPCHLSFSGTAVASDNGAASEKQQAVKLFLAPDITVKAGSKIVVTQNGVEKAYKNSGEPAVYPSHQEIMLELFERWT